MGVATDVVAARYRGRMVRAMVREGLLNDPRWRAAFADVPRHRFLPRFFRPVAPNGWAPVDHTDPDWMAQIYANRVLVTQLDGDPGRWAATRSGSETHGVPTSSSSMPGIMAVMLDALEVADGHRVLEIGAGTGYNAALLCHRLGADGVSTVDVDAALVEAARSNLAGCGYEPTCEAADGELGYPPNAPYDRVLGTCSVSTIPLAWLDQTVPGGLVVTALNRPLGAGLVRITAGEGPCGTGRVLADDGRFMPLRAHRLSLDETLIASLASASGSTRSSPLPMATVASPVSPFEFFAGLALPDTVPLGPGLLLHPDGSWARQHPGSDDADRHEITQGGPRNLWDEVETAYTRWIDLDQPRRSRFGITADPTAQYLWLDTPDSPHRWPLGVRST